jgi:hypothetical protein
MRESPHATPCAPASIEVVPATMEHARAIVLRPGDAREIAAHGVTQEEGLRLSLERSLWADAYLAAGEVAAILGCGSNCLLGGYATPWLITGMPVDRHRKEFLRLTKARIEELRTEHPVMVNWIHAPYVESLRWARWLGFTVEPPTAMGPRGEPFCRIVMKGEADGH